MHKNSNYVMKSWGNTIFRNCLNYVVQPERILDDVTATDTDTLISASYGLNFEDENDTFFGNLLNVVFCQCPLKFALILAS